ncbi:hypothetical protein [Hyphococcus lacteus]|uniref:MarR family transcriptional regulator n=1 Tax=Hyphococcus lacteus TaxID=3143536 RepID=A0ABV3Z7Z1_9PROT
MKDDELREVIITMFSGGVVNTKAIEALHDRGYIRNISETPDEKRCWEITDEGKSFAGLDV